MTNSSAFFFCKASNYSLNACITEFSSMVIDLNVELLVATIYSCDERKFNFVSHDERQMFLPDFSLFEL